MKDFTKFGYERRKEASECKTKRDELTKEEQVQDSRSSMACPPASQCSRYHGGTKLSLSQLSQRLSNQPHTIHFLLLVYVVYSDRFQNDVMAESMNSFSDNCILWGWTGC